MGKAKALHENSNFPTFLYCMPRNQEGPVQNPHTELPQDSAWDFRGAQVISDTPSAQFHVPDSLLIQLLGIPRKTDQTDICPSVRSDVSNCFYQGVSNEWSPREQFQHHERDSGTKYNRNDNQISEMAKFMRFFQSAGTCPERSGRSLKAVSQEAKSSERAPALK